MKMNSKEEITSLENKIESLEKILDEKEKVWWNIYQKDYKDDATLGWKKYCEFREPEISEIFYLQRKLNFLTEPFFSELPDFGDIFELDVFVECCKSGGFIDYDGCGNYIKDDKQSDITIKPSDVKFGFIRKDFDKIIWFNR